MQPQPPPPQPHQQPPPAPFPPPQQPTPAPQPPYPPQQPPPASRPTGPDPVRVAVGLLLALPAAIALLAGYVWPTGRTIWWSLHAHTGIGGTGDWVFLDNHDRVFGADLLGSFGFALLLATLPLLVLLIVAPLLALAAHHAGRPVRLTVRLALTVPMVCFAPAALAVAWRIDRFDVEAPRASVWAAVGLTAFGLLCGLGVVVYLAVLRGRAPGRSAWPAGLTVGALAVIATLAVTMQLFTYPWNITQGSGDRGARARPRRAAGALPGPPRDPGRPAIMSM